MRLISFISNSKAAILALIAVAIVETAISLVPAEKLDYHFTEKMLREASNPSSKEDGYLLLGDSVGSQVLNNLALLGARNFASNQAVGIPGQYFLTHRYLLGHPVPKKAVFLGNDTFDHDLSDVWVENYFQRDFNRVSEVLDVLTKNFDPSFALSSLAYGLSPSYRYRLKISDALFSRFHPATPNLNETPAIEERPHSIATLLRQALRSRFSPEPLSAVYFDRLAGLFDEKGIDFLFIAAPIPKSRAEALSSGREDPKRMLSRRHDEILKSVAAKHPHFKLLSGGIPVIYDDSYFRDSIHLTEKGLELYSASLRGALK